MATQGLVERDNKPSFAKVAAMAHIKPNTHVTPKINGVQSKPENVDKKQSAGDVNGLAPTVQIMDAKPEHQAETHGDSHENHLNAAMGSLRISSVHPKGDSTDHAVAHFERTKHDAYFDDDETHLSNSSTKPTSLDSKSAASTTAFPFDEKESLRPDDSASVQAIEEDESISGRASGTANSRVGSEGGHRPFRDQYREINERIGSSAMRHVVGAKIGIPGVQEEKSPSPVDLQSSVPLSQPTLPGNESFPANDTPLMFLPRNPDDKLLEAMESPKDRLFLLQLEQKVILFVRDSKDPILDLPPSNSFCRLLTHKLADYYHLTHFVDNNVSSVRLFRTPYCRLPEPLSSISNSPTTGHTPPPSNFKIMRRGDPKSKAKNGDPSAINSSLQSKSSSENGGDNEGVTSPGNSSVTKDRATLSREEREAKYKEARERIFKGIEESDPAEAGTPESGNSLSRSSSRSGKKKSKKHKNFNDDGFEARSQYNAVYTSVDYSNPSYGPMPGGQAFTNQYVPNNSNFNAGYGRSTFVPMQQMQGPSYQQYPQPNSNYMVPYPMMPGVSNQTSNEQSYPQVYPHNYSSPKLPNPMPVQQSPRMPSPIPNTYNQYSGCPPSQHMDQQWNQNYYGGPYQPCGPQNQQPVHWPNFPPVPSTNNQSYGPNYPYGTFPNTPFNQGTPKLPNQHPMQGNYINGGFNPQTKSFIPSSLPPAYRPPGNNYPNTNGGVIPPNRFEPRSMQNNHPPPGGNYGPSPPIPQMNDNNSTGSHQDAIQNLKRQNQNPSNSTPNSLAKWGTPAHLPPKPPPSEVSPFPEAPRSASGRSYAAAILSSGNNAPPNQGSLGVMHAGIRMGP
ncbi:MAG: hypothetical protein M1834_002067 [Cirrosporium novae-zelandiae]|nr:MAG: hypothetical protein M1834_002067 [Cirrosporium novae-zelandiae]